MTERRLSPSSRPMEAKLALFAKGGMNMRFCAIAVLVVALTGCGSTATTSQRGGQASPAVSPSPQVLTAEAVIAKLKTAGMPIGGITVFTAATDNNQLLGRPHQYVGKATWVDTSLPAPSDATSIDAGGSVETFGSAADLQARASYLNALSKSSLFAEYDNVSKAGLVFLRLSGKLTPDQVKAYVAAAKTFLPDLTSSQ